MVAFGGACRYLADDCPMDGTTSPLLRPNHPVSVFCRVVGPEERAGQVYYFGQELERWPSGLRRTPGKRVGAEAPRGFESLPLRQFYPIVPESPRMTCDPASFFSDDQKADAIPLYPVAKKAFEKARKNLSEAQRKWLDQARFKADRLTGAAYPAEDGGRAGIFLGLGDEEDFTLWDAASLTDTLPEGRYHLAASLDALELENFLLGWCLAQYRFDEYKKIDEQAKVLILPPDVDPDHCLALVKGTFLIRDLVNRPAGDLVPSALADEARKIAAKFGANINITTGDDLLKNNFPAIHAVGRAAVVAPRLIDFAWGSEKAPKVTLVGKGVCFDSGGLDIKSTVGMRLMKKDMGGGAHALGLAHMIMALDLPVRLRVLIPAVENAIAGNAYRPGDILQTRQGLTVEVTNTDAEGRIVLADALTLAAEEEPDLLIDFATLTGAARVALGADLPALFTDENELAEGLLAAGERVSDPMWRLPLWSGYESDLKSPIADLLNAAETGFAGSITAALFLRNFAKDAKSWVHFDLYAWNQKNRPGRPQGGEAMGVRAVLSYLQDRFGSKKY